MFVPIADYPKYFVNEEGEVMSHKGKEPRILKPGCDGHGYLKVCLCKENKHKTHRVHRLVALAFIPNPENKKEVDHIDRNKQNNNLTNLRWATHSENGLNKPAKHKSIFLSRSQRWPPNGGWLEYWIVLYGPTKGRKKKRFYTEEEAQAFYDTLPSRP